MKKHIDTIVLLGLYTFFYLVLELAINDYAEPVIGSANVTILYGVGYLAVAAGYLLYSLMRRGISHAPGQRISIIFAAILSGVAFLLISFTASPGWMVACTLLSHLTSGYIGGAVYYHAAMRFKGFRRIGLSVGVAFAGANVVQALSLVILSFLSIPVGRWIERIGLMLALALTIWLIVKQVPPSPHTKAIPGKTPPPVLKYILGGIIAIALLAMMQGLNDGVATSLHADGGDYIVYGYPRLFVIPGLLLAGAVADLKDRRFFPFATLLAMLFLTVAVFLFSTPETYNIATACIYFFASFMTIFSVVPFFEWAPSTERPALTAIAGRSVRYAASGVAIMVSGILYVSASIPMLLILYVILLALLFTVFFFMGQLKLPARKKEELQMAYDIFVETYSFTDREAEILAMLSSGSSTAEIAGALFIADKTVRNHISNMLSKTGLASRADLLMLARQAKAGDTSE